MSKLPQAGKVKTRLAAAIGEAEAADLYEAFLKDTLAIVRNRRDMDVLLSFTPAAGRPYYEYLAPGAILLEQPSGNLGRRLSHAFDAAFGLGYKRVIVIGSDSPHLGTARLEQAFTLLSDRAGVIGPSTDGGYYLLGLDHPVPELFEDIHWSSVLVYQQTLARAKKVGLPLRLLAFDFDVDTVEDLCKLQALLENAHQDFCPSTRSLLASPFAESGAVAS
jgi:hypothetical protein